jgi:site-specific DNA-methyltransferase (adenine-specific)
MSSYNLFDQDAVAWLRSLPTESVDIVVTDPAYESLEKHRAKGTTTRLKVSEGSSNEWFPIFPNVRFPAFFEQVYRVLKKNTHCYMYCDQETMFVAKPMAEAAGFKFRKALIWDKVTIGMGYSYRYRHEMILYLEKGKRRLNDLGIADIITCKRVNKAYPTEKPEEVSRVFIEQSTIPGELVVDPFMGSASVGAAALKVGRNFMGSDISPKASAVAIARLGSIEGATIDRELGAPKPLAVAEQGALFA